MGLPYNFSFTLPVGWTNLRAYYTLATPAQIIESGELRVSGRSFAYTYNTLLQNRAAPNIESEGRISGLHVADPRRLVFAVTALDEFGVSQVRTRTFVLLHDRLISLAEGR